MDTLPALEQALAEADSPAARVRALNALATELARVGQTRRAFDFAHEARERVQAIDDGQLQAQTRHMEARCHFNQANFLRALELLLEAARLYQKAQDLGGAAAAYAGIGSCQHRLGAHDDAAASLLRALETARSLKLGALEINIHNSLGSALLWAGRVDEAARHLARGSELAQAAANISLQTKLLMNQSQLSRHRGDACAASDPAAARKAYALSLEQVTQALALARACRNGYDELHCLGHTGTALRLLGRLPEADKALQQTLSFSRTLNERHVQAETLVELGRLRQFEARLEAARQLLTEGAELARSIAARPVLAQANAVLSEVLEALGDLGGALAAHKEFHAVREAELADSRKHASAAAELWLEFQDATRRASEYGERARQLAEDARRDPLTGLLNRRGFDAQITDLLAAQQTQGLPLSLALIDVDHFKQINDQHTHAVGDQVLQRLAELMKQHCRQLDLPVRHGGDEFLLVLAGADLKAAARVLQRLEHAGHASPWLPQIPGLKVTLSIGVAAHRPDTPIDATIAAADAALYEAKRQGRDRIVQAAPGGG
jgi:diguanylate cyclase (GGDEF)-like protein